MGLIRVLIALAVVWSLATLSFVAYGQQPGPGQYQMRALNFSIKEVYQKVPQTTHYQMSNQIFSTTHELGRVNAPASQKLIAPDTKDEGANPEMTMSLFRQGDYAEIQVHSLVYNQLTQKMEPNIMKREIRLTKGTWQGFESQGQEVEALIVDPRDISDVVKIAASIAETYFQLVYKPMLDRNGQFSVGEPQIQVVKPAPTKLLLSSSKVEILYSVEAMNVWAEVFDQAR
ncbi:MAG: hypothetical protein AB7N80_06725 [Bdellovibrionales bacterium]